MLRLLRSLALTLACLAAWPHVGRASTLINGNGGGPIVYAGTNYTGGSQQIGPYARDFEPDDIAGLVLWLRADRGVTVAQGPVTATGTTPPAVTLSGSPLNTSSSSIEIDITLLGTLGVAQFQWKFNGVVQQTGQTTAASFPLAGTGLTAAFAAGTYAANDVYTSVLTVSAWADQSGLANSVTQGTGGRQPTFVASKATYGGQPMLQLAGGQELCGTLAGGQAQPFTVYVVWESDNASNVVALNSNSPSVSIGSGASGQNFFYGFAGTVLNGSSSSSPHVMAVVFNGASSAIYVDNSQTAFASATTGAAAFTGTAGQLGIGGGCPGNSNNVTGFIGAVALYGGSHTAAQRKLVFSFLGARFNLVTSWLDMPAANDDDRTWLVVASRAA